MKKTEKSTRSLILTAIMLAACMFAILFIVAPTRPAKANGEVRDCSSNYHVLGQYDGYNIKIKAYKIGESSYYSYCDVFEHFFNEGAIRWNNGIVPSSCSNSNLAGFTCLDCNKIIIFALSGEHNFDNKTLTTSNGCTARHCTVCDGYIITDFYKAENNNTLTMGQIDCRFSITAGTTLALTDFNDVVSIDWGDGTVNTDKSHNYANEGNYVCVIYGPTVIPSQMFKNNRTLTAITISEAVTSIGNQAFNNCTSLTSITVHKNNANYKSIDGNLYSKEGKTLIQYAIGKTDTSFNVPKAVTSIGDGAFYGCAALKSLTINASTPPTLGSSAIPDNVKSIYVPTESVSKYKAANGWSAYARKIVPLSEQTQQEDSNPGTNNDSDWFTNISAWASDNAVIIMACAGGLIVFVIVIVIMLAKRRK